MASTITFQRHIECISQHHLLLSPIANRPTPFKLAAQCTVGDFLWSGFHCSISLCFPHHRSFPKKNSWSNTMPPLSGAATKPLKVVTMTFGQSNEHQYIEHNCMRISPTQHHFVVFTDDLSQAYCSKCECRLFTRDNREKCMKRNNDDRVAIGWCEKLYFFVRLFDHFDEFVLLDSDLLILKDEFLDRLSARTRVHDFLATYGHTWMTKLLQYCKTYYSSGLLFIHDLPNIDYNEISQMWDILSWKWHCRGLITYKQDIPVSHCYTIHDNSDAKGVFKELNPTMLRVLSN